VRPGEDLLVGTEVLFDGCDADFELESFDACGLDGTCITDVDADGRAGREVGRWIGFWSWSACCGGWGESGI
jgi:hypothetical protein